MKGCDSGSSVDFDTIFCLLGWNFDQKVVHLNGIWDQKCQLTDFVSCGKWKVFFGKYKFIYFTWNDSSRTESLEPTFDKYLKFD